MATLHAVAFVMLSASVGLAVGAGSVAPRKDAPDERPRKATAPRQEIARSPGASCSSGDAPDDGMALVSAGNYRSFFKRDGKAIDTPVAPFRLDRHPVTRAAFGEFVRNHPEWSRSRVQRLFAEEAYLSDFTSDTEPGGTASAPVTFVSWFAARAYCACRGKRLATLAEWERAAGSEEKTDEQRAAPPSRSERLAFAMGGGPRANGAPEFGSVWEWTEDFDGAPVSSRTSDAAQSNLFCGAGIRAADASDYGGFLRFSFRSSLRAAYTLKNLGFRCAAEAE